MAGTPSSKAWKKKKKKKNKKKLLIPTLRLVQERGNAYLFICFKIFAKRLRPPDLNVRIWDAGSVCRPST